MFRASVSHREQWLAARAFPVWGRGSAGFPIYLLLVPDFYQPSDKVVTCPFSSLRWQQVARDPYVLGTLFVGNHAHFTDKLGKEQA